VDGIIKNMYIPIEHEKIPIVTVENFLPRDYINKLMTDFINLKEHFGIPMWTHGKAYHSDEPLSPLCTGQDLWLPFEKEHSENNKFVGKYVKGLNEYIFHQGILNFLTNCRHEELTAYSKFRYHYKYHIVNYGDASYYNWHRDLDLDGMTWDNVEVHKKNAFTFALTLVKDVNLIKGGDQLFMYKNNIHKIPLSNNQLTIFPSTVYHSCTEITAPTDLAWENKRFNIQAWLCHV
jgi:Rps23 Pro-64 3,4-dihydroxylase Tpa1-like proline 4-hydroxylase